MKLHRDIASRDIEKKRGRNSEIDDVAAPHELLRLRQREKRDRDKTRLRRTFRLLFLSDLQNQRTVYVSCMRCIYFLSNLVPLQVYYSRKMQYTLFGLSIMENKGCNYVSS